MGTHELRQAVARFKETGPVHPVVIASWRRSEAAGLDREAPPRFRRVSAEDLEERLQSNRALLEIGIPHLQWLSDWFDGRRHVVYLVDRDGVVLHAVGDPDAIDRYHLSPGYDWSEARMGTNGAGTALASGVPVAVVGCDHWSRAWSNATCLAAPVFSGDGTLAGAIDISMDVQEGDADRLVIAAHVAYTITQELARGVAEARNRATEALYEAAQTALEAEREARAASDAALARAQSAEAALRAHQQRLQVIVDSTPAFVYVVDAAGRFELVNRHFAAVFALRPEEIVGRSVFDCFDEQVAAQFAANNRRVIESGEVCEFEEVVPVRADVRTYISVKAPLFGADGVPSAICGVSTDITEQKRLIAALEKAQHQKDAFIATVAHELRQPLAAIEAALAVMRSRSGREQGERARTILARQVQQLTRMVEDLLDAARIAQGRVALQRERTALSDVLEGVTNTVQPLVRERGQHLHVSQPADPVWIDADPARLQQVFSNLLTNAVKFTPQGGTISVSVERDGDWVTVRVRDTGEGIAADALPHIFDLFVQASPDARGLGVGLALVRRLVERHGGTVEARSEGPGHGSEFLVRLPVAP